MDFYLPVTGIFASIITLVSVEFFYFLLHNTLPAVLCALLVQYLCFNLFHLDGLIDTADAFLGTVDRDKTHAILKDSRMGTYGFFAGTMTLALKTILLFNGAMGAFHPAFASEWAVFTQEVGAGVYLFFLYPVAGRFAAALIPALSKPARTDGLGALAKDSSILRSIAGALVSCAVLFLCICLFKKLTGNIFPYHDFRGFVLFAAIPCVIITFIAAFASALFYSFVYKKRLGGYTGDALGAAVETAEAVYLLFAVIFIRFSTGIL
jgi:adenosylcobinamide-GDP ribazoletransferase